MLVASFWLNQQGNACNAFDMAFPKIRPQASAYEKQGPAIIARFIAKFRGVRRVKSRMLPAK